MAEGEAGEERQALPPGMERDDDDEGPCAHQEPEEPPPPVFAFRKRNRRSVMVCIGDLQKMVPYDLDAA